MWEAYISVFKFVQKLKGSVRKTKVLTLTQNGSATIANGSAATNGIVRKKTFAKTFKQRIEGRHSRVSIADVPYLQSKVRHHAHIVLPSNSKTT